MFPQSISARKIMISSVALIVAAVVSFAGGESMNTCVLQKSTVVEEHKLSTLENIFGETLITESNDNIYVISICRHVPEMYYDARKMTGAIKLTADGNTIDLGHIDQSNIIVNENSIVLTYIGGDRDKYAEDTCKGLRWKTYLTFLCDPSINYDILTLIDEDPEQPEICQVWFEVKTSKTCIWHSNIPLAVLEKDFSTRKNLTTKSGDWRTVNEKYNVRESTNSNNNNKSFRNEKDNTSKENKTNNEEIKKGNSTQIISKTQKKQSDIENKDNYLNKYKKSFYEKIEKEKVKKGNSKIYEDKMLVDHENNNDLENKFTNIKINNTISSTSYNKEYSYPGKNKTILHYNNLKKYINQNKNSEGKYENLLINELKKNDQNKEGQLNESFPKMEKISTRNTFEKQTSNKEMSDSEDDKKPSYNEKKFNQDYSKKSNLNNDINNKTSNLVDGDKNNTFDEKKIVDISNQSQSKDNKSIIYDDNKIPGNIVKENQTQNQKKNLEPIQIINSKTVIKKNTKNINGLITPRDVSKIKPTDSEETSVDTNNTNATKHNTSDSNEIIDTSKKNKMKNNYFKPKENSQSNANESDEVNGSSTELPIDTSMFYKFNNIKTNDKSKPNGTVINHINNVNKNIRPEQLEPEPRTNLSDNENDDSKTTKNNMNQSENNFSFNSIFSKIFGKGFTAKIIGSIISLISIASAAGVVGIAINRFYYKKTGMDQIPFKETFQSISNLIKNCITKFFCCCRVSGGDLEAQNSANEKTPLLQPTFNISSPLVVDEKSQKPKNHNKKSDDEKQQKSDSTDNDDSSQQKSNNEYGSMTNENKSLAKNVEEKLINIENNLQGKSIKDSISEKINTIFNEKIKPTTNSIFKNVGEKVESNEEIKKNLDIIPKDAAMTSKLVDNENSIKNTDDKNVEIKPKNTNFQLNNDKKQILNLEENNENDVHNITEISTNVDVEKSQNEVPLNEIEIRDAIVQEHINSKTLGESQQFQNVTPISEVTISKLCVPDLQQIETNEQAPDIKTTSILNEDTTKELIENAHVKKDVVTKNKIEDLVDTVLTPHTETKIKINESKLKFLGFEKEDKNNEKVVFNKSTVPEKNGENEEEVEVIEEIVYVDGADGDEDEEIIEEIIETTTVEDLPDTLDESGSGHTKVTVHTTRKISSSSLPGEVRTIEETVVTDGVSENEKQSHGFQFGIGKSGVSMSVGDKKLEIGMPKLNRSKSKSPKNVEDDEPDKRGTKSPEKSKKSMSMPKIFKRSISQPADNDIPEAEGEPQLASATIKKSSRPSAGLLIFGKSRSKSSLILDTVDVDVDTSVVSDFIDNERNASRISNTGIGDFNIAVGNEDVNTEVAVRKTSTKIPKGKDSLSGIDTIGKSPTGLLSGSVKVQQSTKSPDIKSNAKTKREKKEKTKLTTLSRPF